MRLPYRSLAVGIAATMLLLAQCSERKDAGAREGYSEARERMVRAQLMGPGRDITDERVLMTMAAMPRHKFVPDQQQWLAYADRPLAIGYGQTISQPYIVALMTEKLATKDTDRVLEIGTGSGYQAAVLSRLVEAVYSVEIVPQLAERAAATLERLQYENVYVRTGDGYLGWPEEAPFDAIIVTCAPDHVPQPLVDQLKEGGRMIIPVRSRGGYQELHLLEKLDGNVTQQAVLPVRFVPMTGESQGDER